MKMRWNVPQRTDLPSPVETTDADQPQQPQADVPPDERNIRRGLQLQISERRLLLMAGDAITIVLSVFVSLRIWAFVAGYTFDLDFVLPQLYWFFVLVSVWFILANANDFYNLRITARISTSIARLAQITLQLLIIYLVIFFLSPRDALPRLFILYHAVISFVLMLLWRVWRPFLIGWSRFRRRRALIVGTGWAAETILQTVSTEASEDYEIVGLIGDEREIGQVIGGKPVLGNGKNLASIAQRYGIAELIMAYGTELPGDIFQGIMACYEREITIVPMPLLYEQITGRVPIEHVGQQHWAVVLPIEGRSVFNLYSPMKRLMDVVLALIGLAIFVVILPPLALLMALDCPGPIFYRQERVGRGGSVFQVIKLRTMIPNAEGESGPQWAQKNDPRITRLGRILRKTRLDEVPQLINVLRGDMSIVGPRPERPVFVDQLAQQIPFYRTRHVVKPGLTGWAQVCYHYGNTTEDALVKLQYDLYYIRHQSLVLDLQIALRTLGTMLAFQGT
jgi:exopolysaccharide biosynthesis polyprenyl glycosylphosphotransferase